MAEAMAPSSDGELDEPIITLDVLKQLSGVLVAPSTSEASLLELKRHGYTTEDGGDGVVFWEDREEHMSGGTYGNLQDVQYELTKQTPSEEDDEDALPMLVDMCVSAGVPDGLRPVGWVSRLICGCSTRKSGRSSKWDTFSPDVPHELMQRNTSRLRTAYPTGGTMGEYEQLSSVTASSKRITENRQPSNSEAPEAVHAYVQIIPSIVRHEHEAGFRLSVEKFHMASHGMNNAPDERGYFIHTATVSITPKWTNPSFVGKIWPAAKPKTAVISKYKEKHAEATLSSAPCISAGGGGTRGRETAIDQWDWTSVVASDPSTAKWKWQMRTWGDSTPFDANNSHVYPVGGVPELPYEVHDGVAGLVITDDPEISRHTEAEWSIPTDLITGLVGQLKVEIDIRLNLQLVKSNTFLVRVANKLVRVSNRAKPGCLEVNMSGTFAF